MAKEEVIIRGVTEYASKKTNEPFWVIETDTDELTCFDAGIKDVLEKHIDFLVVLEVQRKGKYINVKEFIEAKEKQKAATGVSRGEEERIASMLTSYVKDLIVAEITADKVVDVNVLTGRIMTAYEGVKKRLSEPLDVVKTEVPGEKKE